MSLADHLWWFAYWQLTTVSGLICLPLEILAAWVIGSLFLITWQDMDFAELTILGFMGICEVGVVVVLVRIVKWALLYHYNHPPL